MRLRLVASVLPLVLGFSLPALAGTLDTPTCKRELAVAANLDAELAKLKSPRARVSDASCAAYRTQFLVAVRARAAVAACKTGSDREQEVLRLDGTVEDINGAIAQSCAGS